MDPKEKKEKGNVINGINVGTAGTNWANLSPDEQLNQLRRYRNLRRGQYPNPNSDFNPDEFYIGQILDSGLEGTLMSQLESNPHDD
jgi:hypothetical protein